MKIYLDEPQPIAKLRELYNDSVTFLTDVNSYPLISAIEFSGGIQKALKKKIVPLNISKKIDRVLARLDNSLKAEWEKAKSEVLTKAKVSKLVKQGDEETDAEFEVEDAEAKKDEIKGLLSQLALSLALVLPDYYQTLYSYGKERGQGLTGQPLDGELTEDDLKRVKELLDKQTPYLNNFVSQDLYDKLSEAIDQQYSSETDYQEAVSGTMDGFLSRLGLYATAGLAALADGFTSATQEANVDEGELTYPGGIWHTANDDKVCPGCEEQDEHYMTWDEFQKEYQTNQCLVNCRCGELFEPADDTGVGKSLSHEGLCKTVMEKGGAGSGSWEGPGQPRFAWVQAQKPAEGQTPQAGKQYLGDVASKDLNTYNEIENTISPEMKQKIQDAREKLKNGTPSKDLHFKDGKYTEERAKLHQEIISKFDNPKAVAQGQPTIVLTGGIPGSGKSSILEGKDVSNYVQIDSDEIKKSLPEYAGWNAALLQTEADDIIHGLVSKALQDNKNIIIDSTMRKYSEYDKLVDNFKNAGYKVGVWFANLPMDKAMRRAVERFDKTGRFVDLAYIATHDEKNVSTFQGLKSKLDFYEHYNMDVARGEKPVLVESK